MWDFLGEPFSLPLWTILLHATITVLLVLAIWSMRHRHEADFHIDTEDSAIGLVPSIAGLTHGHLIDGNAVEIVENGNFFDRLLDDILAAESSIHFETFLWKEGEIGRTLGEALRGRAKSGVEVRVLVDANGSKDIGEETVKLFDESDVAFARFHRVKLRHFARLNTRTHRKLAVIDGRTAYVGGHCVVDTWLGDAEDSEHFRDVSLRLQGPVVQQLQSVFSENWIATTGELFVGDAVFPDLKPEGNVPAHVVRLHLDDMSSDVKVLHHLMIRCAQRRIRIQNPYFIPDPAAIDLLIAAVERGVDVRVMTPSPSASDMPVVQLAAHRNFQKLLDGGIRLYEYEKTLLHQKVMTVDGSWACVGSTNFDDRSFEINKEVTVGICDRDLIARLDEIFEKDLEHCTTLDSESWAKRSIGRRAVEHFLYLFNEQI